MSPVSECLRGERASTESSEDGVRETSGCLRNSTEASVAGAEGGREVTAESDGGPGGARRASAAAAMAPAFTQRESISCSWFSLLVGDPSHLRNSHPSFYFPFALLSS